jgi:ATP-dependent DNA helicase Rep
MLERQDDEEPDAVKLSTLHASKGLEYPHVFLVGAEEGLLPHLGREDDDSMVASDHEALARRIQEERRLMYVGITRAQRSLFITWCKRRRRAREDVVREPSRFIAEMGVEAPGLGRVDENEGLSPKERLGMLKALLNKP